MFLDWTRFKGILEPKSPGVVASPQHKTQN
jgi:hypothetical protein